MKKLRPNLKLGLSSVIALFITLFSASVLAALPPAAQTILEGLRPEFSSTQVSPSVNILALSFDEITATHSSSLIEKLGLQFQARVSAMTRRTSWR